MESFAIATAVVALAEVGDKTQLLAMVLAARFQRPWPIIAGILIATLANHALAAAVGGWLAALLAPELQQWLVALAFLAMGVWILVPDKEDDVEPTGQWNAFLATLVAFFLVEIGDKTQIATVVLAARYEQILMVVAGTTVGMLAANAPAVWLGNVAAHRLPLRWIRLATAVVFVVLAVFVLLGSPLTA